MISGSGSVCRPVVFCVPQAVQGPVLFIATIRNLEEVMACTCIMSADVTKLRETGHSLEGRAAVQGNLDRLEAWASRNLTNPAWISAESRAWERTVLCQNTS